MYFPPVELSFPFGYQFPIDFTITINPTITKVFFFWFISKDSSNRPSDILSLKYPIFHKKDLIQSIVISTFCFDCEGPLGK